MTDLSVLKVLAYAGGDWVIYFLILCSILTVAVIIDRFVVQTMERRALAQMKKIVMPLLESTNLAEVSRVLSTCHGVSARILSSGLKHLKDGRLSAGDFFESARMMEKQGLEHRLIVLGTLGNNAPFIGLFGTVLGVIKAFHDLAAVSSAGPEVVMQGLSEALVATAVGLLVAIPSVVAYNYFQKWTNDILTETDAMVKMVLAAIASTEKS